MSRKIDLKKYLNNLMILESEKIRLDKILSLWKSFSNSVLRIEKRKKMVFFEKIEILRKNEIKNIKVRFIDKPKPPVSPKEVYIDNKNIIFFILGLMEVSSGIVLQKYWISIVGAWCALYFGLGLFEQIAAKKEYKNNLKEYEKEIKEYNEKIEKYNKKQKFNKNKIKNLTDEINKKYDEQIKIEEKNYEDKYNEIIKIRNKIIADIIKIIEKNIKEVKKKLKRLYDLDIIFGKYRNFVIIATFYEYFITSRVNELEGKEGAYHLYEQEMKQKEFITNVEYIPCDFEKIKEKQYCLYEQLLKNKNSILQIEKNIDIIKKEIQKEDYKIEIIKNYILNCKNEINKNNEQIKNI